MVKNRAIPISIIVICIAAGVFFASNNSNKAASSHLTDFISPGQVRQIELAKAGQKLRLVSRDSRWYVADSKSLEIAADSSRLLPVFDFLNDARIVQKITQKESAYPEFEVVGDKATTLSVSKNDGSALTLHIGKSGETGLPFVKKDDDPYVYLVSKSPAFSPGPDEWLYKKILDYAPANLDSIDYTCSDSTVLSISYDAAKDAFSVKAPPENRQQKNLANLKNAFLNIAVSKYTPRSSVSTAAPLAKHTLHFKNSGAATLVFVKAGEEKPERYFIDIRIDAAPDSDKDLRYLKDVADKYLFEVGYFDKNRYQRAVEDFFEPLAQGSEKNAEKGKSPAPGAASDQAPAKATASAAEKNKTGPLRKKIGN